MNEIGRRSFLKGFGALLASTAIIPPAAAFLSLPPERGGVLNVRDFGAVGDGWTDDSAAIRRAFAATSPGQTVYFPSGTYWLPSTYEPDGRPSIRAA